mmetsp:Transcript_17354/g.19576  ORF Transcript_17354/g.19576 Transcript_17354/m.19576 type:complete len:105 (-) Transcript_17354:561-875(-)
MRKSLTFVCNDSKMMIELRISSKMTPNSDIQSFNPSNQSSERSNFENVHFRYLCLCVKLAPKNQRIRHGSGIFQGRYNCQTGNNQRPFFQDVKRLRLRHIRTVL